MPAVEKSNFLHLELSVLLVSENSTHCDTKMPGCDFHDELKKYALRVLVNESFPDIQSLFEINMETKTVGNINCIAVHLLAIVMLPVVVDPSSLSPSGQTEDGPSAFNWMCVMKACDAVMFYRPGSPDFESAISNCTLNGIFSDFQDYHVLKMTLFSNTHENSPSCPYVELSMDELYSVMLQKRNLTFFNNSTHNMSDIIRKQKDGTFHICAAYLPLLPNDKQSPFLQVILSYACMGVSSTCLVLTMLVYTALPSLRNQPGVNLLNLAVSMLFSHVLFISAAIFKHDGSADLSLSHYRMVFLYLRTKFPYAASMSLAAL